MELILNCNQYEYTDFLNADIDILTIGLNEFCVGYLKTYTLEELSLIANKIHDSGKKIYLSINIIANQSITNKFQQIVSELTKINIDGFVVADFGLFQILKEHNIVNKVVFNPVTNITNKYSASITNNLGINHCCLANELNIKDILDICEYTKGNVEILAQGYYQICNSKRSLLTNFFNKHKIKNTSEYYSIKEENREYAYPIIELNGDTIIYIDKQRCVLPYLKEILATNIKYLRIDTMFLSIEEVNNHIQTYNTVINDIDSLRSQISRIETYSNSNLKCLDNISILKKEKKND